MASAKKKSPQDGTGKTAEKNEVAKAEAAAEAAAKKAAEDAAKAEQDKVVVVQDGKSAKPLTTTSNLTAKPVAEAVKTEDDEGEKSDDVTVVGESFVRVKAMDDFDSHVGGANYTFEGGKKYDVPRGVAEFLSERDYLEILE